MSVVSVRLDFPLDRLPYDMSEQFEWSADGEHYLYLIRAYRLKWFDNSRVWGNVTITKFKKVSVRWWHLRRRGWSKVWSFDSGSAFIINGSGGRVRENITREGINKGVLPTELLLNKSLGPIEDKLRAECRRIADLARSRSARSVAV